MNKVYSQIFNIIMKSVENILDLHHCTNGFFSRVVILIFAGSQLHFHRLFNYIFMAGEYFGRNLQK